jgi:hypothetical protein
VQQTKAKPESTAKKKPRKRTVTTVEEIDVDEGESAEGAKPAGAKVDDRDFSKYDVELRSYIATQGGHASYVATLYKYDTLYKQKQFVCHESRDSVMRPHEVGMAVGPGEYRYKIEFDNPEFKLGPFYFNVHPIYDEYRSKAGLGPVADPRAAQQGRNALPDTLELMDKLVAIMQRLQPAQAPQVNPAQARLAEFSLLDKTLDAMLTEKMAFQKTLLAERSASATPQTPVEDDEDEKEYGIMEKLAPFMPLIEKMVGVILGGGPGAQVAVEGAKAIPQIAEMLKDPAQLAEAVVELDQKFGKEETDQILKKFGKKRPKVVARVAAARAA